MSALSSVSSSSACCRALHAHRKKIANAARPVHRTLINFLRERAFFKPLKGDARALGPRVGRALLHNAVPVYVHPTALIRPPRHCRSRGRRCGQHRRAPARAQHPRAAVSKPRAAQLASADQATDWPPLADAWGSLRRAVPLKAASGAPAGRGPRPPCFRDRRAAAGAAGQRPRGRRCRRCRRAAGRVGRRALTSGVRVAMCRRCARPRRAMRAARRRTAGCR